MTAHEIVKAYLESEPRARERVNKDRALVNILLQDYPNLKEYKELLIVFAHRFETLNREWRAVTQANPHLQGSDYNDKVKLSQKVQLERGYEVGFNRDIKNATNIS